MNHSSAKKIFNNHEYSEFIPFSVVTIFLCNELFLNERIPYIRYLTTQIIAIARALASY